MRWGRSGCRCCGLELFDDLVKRPWCGDRGRRRDASAADDGVRSRSVRELAVGFLLEFGGRRGGFGRGRWSRGWHGGGWCGVELL